ncbi:AAA family ATPase [Neptunicella marina]|uniref:ATP-binding protein n=1 Tax=Neptunicella marina TaxID=2125989 RepID=A0A8J6IT31_9ALTE|nr:ATP-binding protein [Neptunicella marina]MBC3765086.1 ATP-binding protein [Neptunicella marina]
MKKWVFLGAPSTGKTTLINALSQQLNTNWVEEYGRDYWLEHQVDRRLTPGQLLHIAQMQNQMEDAAISNANRILLCDTNAFTTWHFALHYHNSALPELSKLASECWTRYQRVIVCDTDIPYDDTWERSGDANRIEFQAFILDYLKQHKIPFTLVSGSVEKRMQQVLEEMPQLA